MKKHHRLIQTGLLLIGLVGIGIVVAQTFDAADEQVLPTPVALVAGGVLSIVAITCSARAWVSLFSDLVKERDAHLILRGTFYLAQLTKYVPAGGIVQTASQVGLAPTAGVPIRRAAVAFPVSAVGTVVACGTLSSGLVFDTELSWWWRLLSLGGLALIVFLHRGPMAWALDLAHRMVKRIPGSEELPTQRDIISFYLWALLTLAALCGSYTVLLASLDVDANPVFIFCAFALSFLIGFLAIPIPAGVGVREAVLVALLPGVGTAPLLAASLAARLLSIGAELLAIVGNKAAIRRHGRAAARAASAEVAAPADEPTAT